MIKIDVEGAELSVLRGMKRLLSQPCAPLLFIEINASMLALQGTTPDELVAFVEGYGYVSHKITPIGVHPARELVDEPLALFRKPFSCGPA